MVWDEAAPSATRIKRGQTRGPTAHAEQPTDADFAGARPAHLVAAARSHLSHKHAEAANDLRRLDDRLEMQTTQWQGHMEGMATDTSRQYDWSFRPHQTTLAQRGPVAQEAVPPQPGKDKIALTSHLLYALMGCKGDFQYLKGGRSQTSAAHLRGRPQP